MSFSLPVLSSINKFQYSRDCFSDLSFSFPIPQCFIFLIFIVPVSLSFSFRIFYCFIPVSQSVIPVPVPCFAFLLSVSRFSVSTWRLWHVVVFFYLVKKYKNRGLWELLFHQAADLTFGCFFFFLFGKKSTKIESSGSSCPIKQLLAVFLFAWGAIYEMGLGTRR